MKNNRYVGDVDR